ncbi:MAG: DUF4465 domain-containing protein [Bacteroidales bacterium]|nr:DUF4465 domain-containing protein [Bacteroidales bacterium]
MKKFFISSIVIFLCLNATSQYEIINFEDLILLENSYWNGSDNSGGFISNNVFFPNTFTDWGGGITSWYGFAYSNMIDDTFQNLNNQYSTFAGQQVEQSTIFGISYNNIDFSNFEIVPNVIDFKPYYDSIVPISIKVTNTTYTALTIKNGDFFCKPFGGVTGNDPDWFKLIIEGFFDTLKTGEIEFYLADYRFANNDSDYIVKEWQNIDLTSLGTITKLKFKLASSDTGQYGMNTPAYFCFDNIQFIPKNNNIKLISQNKVKLFPNPTYNYLFIPDNIDHVQIFDNFFRLVKDINNPTNKISLSELKSGVYIIKLIAKECTYQEKILKL